MIALLLTGCGDAAARERQLEERRDALAEAGRIAFTAQVTAHTGREVFSCVLDCEATAEEMGVTVREPAEIAGIRATVGAGGTQLEYEDVSLSAGSADSLGDGPLAAMPLLLEALRQGHILRVWQERDGETEFTAAEVYVDEARKLTLWFLPEELTPVRASLRRDGAEYLVCRIQNFTWE